MPKAKSQITLAMTGADANSAYLLMVGQKPAAPPLAALRITLMVSSPLLTELIVPSGSTGSVSMKLTVPSAPGLAGSQVTMQLLALKSKQVVASNGVAIKFCK